MCKEGRRNAVIATTFHIHVVKSFLKLDEDLSFA